MHFSQVWGIVACYLDGPVEAAGLDPWEEA